MSHRLPRSLQSLAALLAFPASVLIPHAAYADSYLSIPFSGLEYSDGSPFAQDKNESSAWHYGPPRLARVVLDGGGEAYAQCGEPINRWYSNARSCRDGKLYARVPDGQRIAGTLYLPDPTTNKERKHKFSVPDGKAALEERINFLRGKEEYYRTLLDLQYPGAAWYRHQLMEAERERSGRPANTMPSAQDAARQMPGRRGTLQDTFDLFSGGRAVSENLQLDKDLILSKSGAEKIQVGSIVGITVKELDWAQYNKDKNPEIDVLAAQIPGDQYAVFFPTLTAMIDLTDQLNKDGDEILPLVDKRPEDAMVRERYQSQLALPLSDLARMIGPFLVKSVAITGSDPYFRTGTDVAVLFEGREKPPLVAYIDARYALARAAEPALEVVKGEHDGIPYHGIRSTDRRISSFLAEVGDAVVVSNSTEQLRRIIATFKTKSGSLAGAGEYRFFRDRYPRTAKGESAFVIVPDAAIRKWGGAEWRIGASRRTRAAAMMSEIQAAHMPTLVKGEKNDSVGNLAEHFAPLGSVSFGKDGVYSERYGSLAFLTPISELGITSVSTEEADAYKRFRDTYSTYWRGYFDPIGASIAFTPDSKSVDLTVMPLILGTDYRSLINLSPGKFLDELSGDPHEDAIIGVTLALDSTGGWMQFADGWGRMILPNVTNPLGWIGGSLSLYLDDSPLVKEVEAAENKEKMLEERWHQIPLGLYVEVRDTFKLTAFLTALRAMAEQSSPGLTKWESQNHEGIPYVKVSEGPSSLANPRRVKSPEWALYYAATPSALIVSLREEVLQRALTRLAADAKTERSGSRTFVKDNSAALEISDRFVNVATGIIDKEQSKLFEERCFSNIPILNEWKRLYPDKDPVQIHTQIWKTRLLCPAGGDFRWNAEWQTMESTTLGHPGEPKHATLSIPLLERMKHVQMGIKFELDGVRAKVLLRDSKN